MNFQFGEAFGPRVEPQLRQCLLVDGVRVRYFVILAVFVSLTVAYSGPVHWTLRVPHSEIKHMRVRRFVKVLSIELVLTGIVARGKHTELFVPVRFCDGRAPSDLGLLPNPNSIRH